MKLLGIIIISLVLISEVYGESMKDLRTVDAAIKPVYGVAFGEFGEEYSNPKGIMLSARGLYAIDLTEGRLLPEVRSGWLYLSHKSEAHRQLRILPLNVHLIWDWDRLHFTGAGGAFSIHPYAGYGLYYVQYSSDRKSEYGFDNGYQAGINIEYRHSDARDFFFELGVEHFLITEIDTTLTGIIVSVGAGCTLRVE